MRILLARHSRRRTNDGLAWVDYKLGRQTTGIRRTRFLDLTAIEFENEKARLCSGR